MKQPKLFLLLAFLQLSLVFANANEYVAFAKQGKVYHLIDETGAVISKEPMAKVMNFYNSYASCVIAKKWHYINQQGLTFTIPGNVDKLTVFTNGMGAFRSEKKWGFMNNKGEVVIPVTYEDVKMFKNGLCWVKKSGKWFQINKEGKAVFENGYLKFHYFTKDGIARVKDEYKWGYINRAGEELVGGLIYTEVAEFYNGKAFVKQGELWGLIDTTGKFIIEPKYVKVWHYLKNGYALVKSGYYIGIINQNGEEIVSPKYDKITDFREGFCGAKLNDKWSVIDKNGKTIAKGLSSFYDFKETYATIEKNEQTGLLTTSGEVKILGKYDRINAFVNGYAIVQKNDRWGYIDNNLNEIISPRFIAAKEFYTDWTIVKANNELWGYINHSGEFEINAEYEKPDMFVRNKQADRSYGCNQGSYFNSGLGSLFSRTRLFFVKADMEATKIARVKYNGQWAFIDKSGTLVLSELDNAEGWVNGFARFRKNGKWGFINTEGIVVVQPQFTGLKEMTKVCL